MLYRSRGKGEQQRCQRIFQYSSRRRLRSLSPVIVKGIPMAPVEALMPETLGAITWKSVPPDTTAPQSEATRSTLTR